MTSVSFISPDGSVHTLDAPTGDQLMKIAKRNGVPGIVGACGGNLQCATCHVIVPSEHLAKLSPPAEDEQLKLAETAYPREENSRLCCQIIASDALDGLSVVVAPYQR
jgi:2Fe-2S ferredoxin